MRCRLSLLKQMTMLPLILEKLKQNLTYLQKLVFYQVFSCEMFIMLSFIIFMMKITNKLWFRCHPVGKITKKTV